MGPADVPQDGGDDEVHVGEAVLFPGTTEVWTKGPANVKIEAGQVLLPVKLDKFFFPCREQVEKYRL